MLFYRVKTAILIQSGTKLFGLIMGSDIRWKSMKVPKGLYLWFVPMNKCFLYVLLNSFKLQYYLGRKFMNIPSFMQIISADGISCSGQTPDIAWEIFQKKGCPRLKTLHGKRLSCKIDGVEVNK